jgi:ankyrin repeat protein
MTTLSQESVKEFVLAAHFDLDKVKTLLAEHPDLLRAEYDWGPGGLEEGIGAAAHVGNRTIAEFFLSKGVPLNICVAAMLGRIADVRAFLAADPGLANARGAHGIPVMFHAAMSGSVEVTEVLRAHGCDEGYSSALHGAINFGHRDMVAWLLDHGATQLDVKDYQDKTPLRRAEESGLTEIAELLRQRGATQ